MCHDYILFERDGHRLGGYLFRMTFVPSSMTAFRKYTKYIKFFYFLKKQLTKDFDKGRNETRERLRDVLSYAENPLF